MKKFSFLVFLFAVFGLVLVGCSDSPKSVAKKYMQALEKGDVTEANKYSTERTHALNGMVVGMLNVADKKDGAKSNKELEKSFKEGVEKLDDARVEINGDSAKLYTDDDEKPMTFKKVDGDWKVDVEK